MVDARLLLQVVCVALVAWPLSGHTQPVDVEVRPLMKTLATDVLKSHLPTGIELYWLDNADSEEESLALRYEWNSNQEWEATDFGDTSNASNTRIDFGGRRANMFVRGNYVQQADVNPSELSEIGGQWSRRWFPVSVTNPLTPEQGQAVQRCVLESNDFAVTSEVCRERLGFGRSDISYWYADVDAHAEIEGDQQFDQRHYVYGVHTNLSRQLGDQRVILNPILSLGLEQVDPANDAARDVVLPEGERYNRVYAKLGFTGQLARIRNQVVKYSVSIRYFKELGADAAIEEADLDSYRYSAFAIQIPAAAIPGFDNARKSFLLTYGSGELPFNRSSEKTFELGFRHDIDFGEFF